MATFKTNDENFDEDIASQNVPVVVDFGAEWCGPCKKIAPVIKSHVDAIQETYPAFRYIEIDVDEAFDIYAFLRRKKMVTSIPTMLMYKAGNHTVFPDDTNVGSDEGNTVLFFQRVAKALSE